MVIVMNTFGNQSINQCLFNDSPHYEHLHTNMGGKTTQGDVELQIRITKIYND